MNNKTSAFAENHDNLEPELESAVWAILGAPLPADAIARVKSQALAIENLPVAKIPPSIRNISRSRRWMEAASLAACVLLVFGATMLLPSSSSAFAQAIEKLKNAGDFRYREVVYLTTQEKPVEVDVLVSNDGRERRSTPGQISIHDSTGQVRLSLNEATKSATVHAPTVHVPTEGISVEPERQIKWLERLKSYGSKPDKELGTMNINGRDCLGFEVNPDASVVYSVWVDPKTSDLVQVEFKGMPKGSSVTKSVMSEFEFNVTLDPKLFSFDAPHGYQSSNAAKLPELLPFEESLVEALKGYTELSGGKFPESITDSAEWMTILSKDGIPRTTLAARIGTLTPYLTGMSHDDYDYTGAGKEVGMERAIVFWYRNPETHLRAVYSDFTIASIADADLPRK
ncbi:MAG: hypothetical protein JNL58_14540 [Planctomyces sp.]|nr:hypothetical protein [Planctomyces sp.]